MMTLLFLIASIKMLIVERAYFNYHADCVHDVYVEFVYEDVFLKVFYVVVREHEVVLHGSLNL